MQIILGVLAIFALVFINGFFVAAEFSLVGARRTRLMQLADEGHAGARAAKQATEHLDSYIAATQLGITLASLGLGWIGEPALAHIIEPVLEFLLDEEPGHTVIQSVSVAVGFSIVTMLHIVLGELAPKSIALQRPEETSMIVARPTTWFLKVFRPVIYVMNAVGNGVVRLLGFEPASGHERVHSAEELGMLVRSSQEAGILDDSEGHLLQQAFDFSEIHIKEVMQPRISVDAIAFDTPLLDMLLRIARGHYSRYPVYEGSVDHVIGILHAKDLFNCLVDRPALLTGAEQLDLRSILRPPLFFPEMAGVDRVLKQMQRTKRHIAIVLDEFGGMAGMATMEDILEELVGEVQDEFDMEKQPISADETGVTYSGLITLDDVIERFGDPGG
ncbi:MAG: HlyC/CorC family transporter, partial [Chloroflexi bacterium]|nr:HlyC/CorC family transporter [Chloroflexota bacterium]